MANGAGHYGHAWRRVRAIVLSDRPLICYFCHQPVDHRLKPPDPGCPNVHCIHPVSRGGDPYDLRNLAPSHQYCNQSWGNKMDNDDTAISHWVMDLEP